MEVKMNKEIRDYQESMFFGLNFRQCAFSVLAILAAVAIYFGTKGRLPDDVQGWLCMLGAAPFAACGFFKYHGMTAEQFLWAFIKSEILYPKKLSFRPENLYYSSSQSSASLSEQVLAYTATIQKYASQYGIPEYVPVIQAIMMQESGGAGTDPMQSSECPYNTRYPNSPGAITDPEYSIEVGVQYYADCVREAGCTSPQDMDKLKLSLQGYNYGNGYISWAVRNYGGYSEANALLFSQQQAASHGWARYGDPEYVPHVLRYYSGGNPFAALFGNEQIVSVALTQLGNVGGDKFWSWYGFDGHVLWCACFVSWCADQCGLIESGAVPRFSLCTDGVDWFQGKGKWQARGSTPTAGMIIFFDWNGDGKSDHVGIVEKSEGGRVYTVEGNSGNAVKQNNYDLNYSCIMGYGVVSY